MSRPNTGKVVGIGAVVALLLGAILWLTRSPDAEESADESAATESTDRSDRRGADTDALAKLRKRKDPSTQPKASVSGTVTDEAGNGIVGAQVCATLDDPDVVAPRMPASCATTGKGGAYLLADLMPARYGLQASARGFEPVFFSDKNGPRGTYRDAVRLPAGDTVKDIDLEMREGGAEISGVVKDVAGGVIPNAYVTISGGWRSGGATFAVTDAEGQFSVWGPSPDASVSAWTEGYASRSIEVSTPGTFVELLLTPESVIVGEVVWAGTGKPAVGVEVTTGGGWWRDTEDTALTDENGEFRLVGLDPGSYKIQAQAI
ncbi:MAG: carboxypeptidase-like regulatory domain-containing protein, partial [Myxococcota bacterium]